MSAPKPVADLELVAAITAVVAKCYQAGDYSHFDYKEVAPYAIKRWRTSKRRHVPPDDIKRRIYDLAKGIARQGFRSEKGPPLPAQVRLAEAIANCLIANGAS